MNAVFSIVIACVAGGVLSVGFAALSTMGLRPSWVPRFVAFAVGSMLGAVFLEILPEAIAHSNNVAQVFATVLGGIMAFFVLEKLVLWRHCHHHDAASIEEAVHEHAGHDQGRSGLMILVGNTFHNFCDGVLIASAFLTDTRVGWVTAIAIIAHEIPQEVGDFLVLLHSGFGKARAFIFNLLSTGATLVGALLAYYALSAMHTVIPFFLALAAASLIYVAIADLIPSLHKRFELGTSVEQALLIAAGISLIAVLNAVLVEH